MGPEFESPEVHQPKGAKVVGVVNAQGPPVPIPNTEVKLCYAYDTWLATVRENK